MSGARSTAGRLGWGVLALLSLAILVLAAMHDRGEFPNLLEGEATPLMQAESILEDGDLTYARLDFDRQLLSRHGSPPDLELRSASRGSLITFDSSIPYAVFLAATLALDRDDGWAPVQALLLVAVGWWLARVLRPRLGPWSPWWIALWIGASALWNHVFWATGDLFFACCAAAAAALLIGRVDGTGGGPLRADDRLSLRPIGAGLLLSIVGVARPLAWPLLLPALMPLRTGSDRARLIVGALAGVMAQRLATWWIGGGLFGAQSFRFTPATGYPLVDFASVEWASMLPRLEALHFEGAARFAWGLEPLLWLWNTLYLLVGESIGLLVYFPPLLLLIVGLRRRGGTAWLIAAGVWAVAVLAAHPFDLADGTTAVANRRFLPLYGLLPLAFGTRAIARLDRRGARIAVVCSVGVLAALWLSSFWRQPGSWPLIVATSPEDAEVVARFRHAGAPQRALFPYETSQRALPGGRWTAIGNVRVRPLVAQVWPRPAEDRLAMERHGRATILVASAQPIEALQLTFGADAPGVLEADGATVGDRLLTPDGGITFELEPLRGRRHAMWWGPMRQSVVQLSFAFADAQDGDGPVSDLHFSLWARTAEAGTSAPDRSEPSKLIDSDPRATE
ncbi:MAG: hypothetical protein AAGN46_02555 [Acidobacteriota bacterium]